MQQIIDLTNLNNYHVNTAVLDPLIDVEDILLHREDSANPTSILDMPNINPFIYENPVRIVEVKFRWKPFYVENTSAVNAVVTISKVTPSDPDDISIYANSTGENFTNADLKGTTSSSISAISIPVPPGLKVYIAGNRNWNNKFRISCNRDHDIGGNILSLIQGTNYNGHTRLLADNEGTYNFAGALQGDVNLENAEDLLLTRNNHSYSYFEFFKGCTSLHIAPTFEDIPMAEYCYRSMFEGCTSFDNYYTGHAFPVLNSTQLATGCYYSMFENCHCVDTGDILPATTLAPECYKRIFAGNAALKRPSRLPATILVRECYMEMFVGTYYISEIKCNATDISAYNCTKDWVNWTGNENPNGVFYKNPSMTAWPYSIDGIPPYSFMGAGWDVADYN